MEMFSGEWFVALFSIVVIDLVLAGDNAVVIAMAARHLPENMQRKAIWLGTGGAILIRMAATLAVVWLLKIPGLLLFGGIILIGIAYRLLVKEKKHGVRQASGLWEAFRTIVVADAVMGLDNVLAIAGAAHGDYIMVIIGLAVSVPIVIWGSLAVLRLIERFPVLIYLGAAVLAFTAGKMIADEPLLKQFFDGFAAAKWLLAGFVVVLVLIAGKAARQTRKKSRSAA
jgi:YjbE family integral membrane protein